MMLRSESSLRTNAGDSTPLLQHRGSGSTPYSPYKKPSWYKRPRFYLTLIRRGIGEFLGTALFVFVAIAASSSVIEDEIHGYLFTSSEASVVALATGLCYAGLMAALEHVSGGHMNPSVTLGVFLAGGINVIAAVVYVCAQIIGGIVGAACVLGIAVETVLTLLVIMVYIHTTMEGEDKQSQNKGHPVPTARKVIAPLACGFTLAAAIISSYSVTGGSFNPARSLGPAIVSSSSERWSNHYVYWVGPLMGGLLAGVFYRLVLSSNPLLPLTEDDTPKSNTRPHSFFNH